MKICSNVDQTTILIFERIPHTFNFVLVGITKKTFLRFFFSQNLQLILERNSNMVVGHIHGACMLIIRISL